MNLGREASVVAQDVDDHRHIDVAGLEDRLAVVEGFKFGELVEILLDQVSELPNEAATLAGG